MEQLSAMSDSTLDREMGTLIRRSWHTIDAVGEAEDVHDDLFPAFSLRIADDECAGPEQTPGPGGSGMQWSESRVDVKIELDEKGEG